MSKLYFNPRCSKSRQAKSILEEKCINFETKDYIRDLTRMDLNEICSILHVSAKALIRTKEKEYVTLKESGNLPQNEDAWKDLIIQIPSLLERPIFIYNGRGIVARPSEKVIEIL